MGDIKRAPSLTIRGQMLKIDKVNKIEHFFHSGEGYNPFFIRDTWQVAQLNFLPGHEPENIARMEVHKHTDEVFILVKGKAVLIAAQSWDKELVVECVQLVQGVVYNIPAGTWHNIAMDKNAQLIIIEKNNTHLEDVEHRLLKDDEIRLLTDTMRSIL